MCTLCTFCTFHIQLFKQQQQEEQLNSVLINLWWIWHFFSSVIGLGKEKNKIKMHQTPESCLGSSSQPSMVRAHHSSTHTPESCWEGSGEPMRNHRITIKHYNLHRRTVTDGNIDSACRWILASWMFLQNNSQFIKGSFFLLQDINTDRLKACCYGQPESKTQAVY